MTADRARTASSHTRTAAGLTISAVDLTHAIAAATATVPGVAELAPTLTDRIRHLPGLPALHSTTQGRLPGVTVDVDTDRITVGIDVAVHLDRPAIATAERVQRTIADLLNHQHISAATVTVSILGMRA